MTALDWETFDLNELHDEKLWDLLGVAQAQRQEIAQCIWDASPAACCEVAAAAGCRQPRAQHWPAGCYGRRRLAAGRQ